MQRFIPSADVLETRDVPGGGFWHVNYTLPKIVKRPLIELTNPGAFKPLVPVKPIVGQMPFFGNVLVRLGSLQTPSAQQTWTRFGGGIGITPIGYFNPLTLR